MSVDNDRKSVASHAQSFVWLDNNTGTVNKISRHDDFVGEREVQIAKRINEEYHQNVAVLVGHKMIKTWIYLRDIDPKDVHLGEMLIISEDDYQKGQLTGLVCDRLLSEWKFIDGCTLSDAFEEHLYSDSVIASVVCQVIFAIFELQEKFRFVHGDLQSGNVMLEVTKDDFYTYNIDGHMFRIPTHGFRAVIIDFGASTFWDTESFLDTPMYGIDEGSHNLWYDELFDIRYFLDSVRGEIFRARKPSPTQTRHFGDELQRLVFNLFTHYEPDGSVHPGPRGDVFDTLLSALVEANEGCHKPSRLLVEDFNSIPCLLFTLVRLPLDLSSTKTSDDVENDINKLSKYLEDGKSGLYVKIIKAWENIERFLTVKQASYVFREIVSFVRQNCNDVGPVVEGNFFNLIHQLLSECGQDMVSLTLDDTAKLYHLLVIFSVKQHEYMSLVLREYNGFTMLSNSDTKEMIISKSGCSSVQIALSCIMLHWYKMTE